jgi:hypothetical protein
LNYKERSQINFLFQRTRKSRANRYKGNRRKEMSFRTERNEMENRKIALGISKTRR